MTAATADAPASVNGAAPAAPAAAEECVDCVPRADKALGAVMLVMALGLAFAAVLRITGKTPGALLGGGGGDDSDG